MTVAAASGADVVAVASSKDGKIVVDGLAVDVSIAHAGKTDQLVINALGGADQINATALAAGKIALTMDGGVGADTLFGSAGNDTVIGGDGNDTVSGGAGNDVFIWNPGDDKDIIVGEAGFDTLRVNGASTSENTAISAVGGHALFFQIAANVVQDLDDVERIEFHAVDGIDIITVNDLSGTDVKQVAIDFAAGGVDAGFADTVITNGSAGNDAIKVALVGGAISITGLSAQVTAAGDGHFIRLEIDALGGNDSVNGSALKLNSVQQLVVDGGAGNDTITGGLGNDFLSGGDDNDKMLGGGGDDQLFGDNGKDVLDGGTGNDSLTGGAGNDVLTGGTGDDAFTGGQGDDTMTGGTGRDELRYTDILDGHDVFIGFDGNAAGGQDALDLQPAVRQPRRAHGRSRRARLHSRQGRQRRCLCRHRWQPLQWLRAHGRDLEDRRCDYGRPGHPGRNLTDFIRPATGESAEPTRCGAPRVLTIPARQMARKSA